MLKKQKRQKNRRTKTEIQKLRDRKTGQIFRKDKKAWRQIGIIGNRKEERQGDRARIK